MKAFEKALEWGDRIPLGIIYRNTRPPFEGRIPVLDGGPLAHRVVSAEDLAAYVKNALDGYR